MSTRWDPREKQVVVTMSWQEARDLGYWLRMENSDPDWAEQLIKAALEGAGFTGAEP